MSRDVSATMRYVVRGEKATFYAGDRDRSYWPGEEHEVVIRDMRPGRGELSLDRNGFVLLDEPDALSGLNTANGMAAYCKRMEQVVVRLTGAEKVVSLGPILRTSAAGTHGHNQPAIGAHVDYGARTVADYTRDLLPPDEAEARLQRHHVLINLWRPLARVESAPLAVCDAVTVRRSDLFDSEIVGGLGGVDRSLWGYNLAFDPDHRWHWAPDMEPRELLAFKLFDSREDAIQHTAHSSFTLREAPADAAPRRSVELRTIAYF